MQATSLGLSGATFEYLESGAEMRYRVYQRDGAYEVIFTRAELVHIRDRAAPCDDRSEGDAIYDGPKFSAVRTELSPGNFGVRLTWKEDRRSHEFLFQGEAWNNFLLLLDAVCVNSHAA